MCNINSSYRTASLLTTLQSLCQNCGLLYERDKRLPPWNYMLFAAEKYQGSRYVSVHRSPFPTHTNPPPSDANPIYQPPPPPPRQLTHLQSDIASFPASTPQPQQHHTPQPPVQQQQQQTPRNTEINPSSHLYTGASAGGQGQISASTMADITNYAEPGEDLDWTQITEPRERKRLQNIINGRKYRERRLAAEGQGGSGGNYPGAAGLGSFMSTGYGQRQSLQRAKLAAAQAQAPGAQSPGQQGQQQQPPWTPQM